MGYVERIECLGEAPMHPDSFEIEEVLSHIGIALRRRALERSLLRESRTAYEPPPTERESRRVSSVSASYDFDDSEVMASEERRAALFYKATHKPPPRRPPPPPWAIGFSKQFHKDTKELDGKLLGRVLKALEELSLCSRPLQPRGDTFKPLEGELKGYWRYRIGDHRLVVQPRVEDARIDALTLAARGSVYD